MKKNRLHVSVSVEINLDTLEPFRQHKRPIAAVEDIIQGPGDEELSYGTKVPRFEHFSEATRREAEVILLIKKEWLCNAHSGEHGEPGVCFVTANGEHICINNRRFKVWSSAVVAGQATIRQPPNTIEFDSVVDGRLIAPKPRGRLGPRSHSNENLQPTVDPTALLMTAMLPMLTNLAERHGSQHAPLPSTSPVHQPDPKAQEQLRLCLRDFKLQKGIDFTMYEDRLARLDYTPDIIPEVDVAVLRDLTGAVDGQVLKLRVFCRDWKSE
ncbi:hypothetical protein QCA50_008230 [Cerrena zonata]|uniref:Uncharacterized protein n=1 Tax=Cerrena zonata TaxID=2478898 RepID=A0AAW0GFJ0_9APHY